MNNFTFQFVRSFASDRENQRYNINHPGMNLNLTKEIHCGEFSKMDQQLTEGD